MAVTSAQVTVTTSAVALSAAETDNRGGESVLVKNTDATNPVYLGASGVTTGTGYKLAAGEAVSFDLDMGEALYAVSGGSVVVGVVRTGI